MPNRTFHHSPVANTSVMTRRVQYDGRDTIIAPVVLMVEGVHNGSAGPLYYPADELQASAPLWNGMPLPVHHPTSPEGNPIACNSPDTVASHSVGRLWNVLFEDNPPRLRGEIYVDVIKAQAINPAVVEALTRNQPLEVSTGLFSADEMIQGVWNNEQYNGIVRSIRPDHLALLPGQRGACSWQDGCGVRANQEKEGGDMNKLELTVNELSLDDQRSAVARAIYAMDGPTQDNMCVAIFNDAVVYETRPGPQSSAGTPTKMYKRGYSINGDGVVTLSDEIAEVKREVSYIPVTNEEAGDIITNHEEEETMVLNAERKQKVDALIANGHYTEEDRTFLENMECPQFTRTEALANKPPVKANEEAVTAKPQTYEEIIANAPADVKARDAYVQNMINQARTGFIARIKSNENNKLDDGTLNAMSTETLESLADSVSPAVDYSGAGGGVHVNVGAITEEPLVMPTLNEEKKDK